MLGLMQRRELLISSDYPTRGAPPRRRRSGFATRRRPHRAHDLPGAGAARAKADGRVARAGRRLRRPRRPRWPWNSDRHLELYYGVSGMGAVCHTINPRLAPDDIAYIINHAEDHVLFVDACFAPLAAAIAPKARRQSAHDRRARRSGRNAAARPAARHDAALLRKPAGRGA